MFFGSPYRKTLLYSHVQFTLNALSVCKGYDSMYGKLTYVLNDVWMAQVFLLVLLQI